MVHIEVLLHSAYSALTHIEHAVVYSALFRPPQKKTAMFLLLPMLSIDLTIVGLSIWTGFRFGSKLF